MLVTLLLILSVLLLLLLHIKILLSKRTLDLPGTGLGAPFGPNSLTSCWTGENLQCESSNPQTTAARRASFELLARSLLTL